MAKDDVSLWTIGLTLFVTGTVVSYASWWALLTLSETTDLTVWGGVTGSAGSHHETFLAMVVVQTAIVSVVVRAVMPLTAGVTVSFMTIFLVLLVVGVASWAGTTALYRAVSPQASAGVTTVPSVTGMLGPVVVFVACAVEASLLRAFATAPGSGMPSSRRGIGKWVVLVVVGVAAVILVRSVDRTPGSPATPEARSGSTDLSPELTVTEVEGRLTTLIHEVDKGAWGGVVTRVSCSLYPGQAVGWPGDTSHQHYTCTSTSSSGLLAGWCAKVVRGNWRVIAFYESRSGCSDPPVAMHTVSQAGA